MQLVWGAHAPPRVPAGALAGRSRTGSSHQTVSHAGPSCFPRGRGKRHARARALPISNCIVTAKGGPALWQAFDEPLPGQTDGGQKAASPSCDPTPKGRRQRRLAGRRSPTTPSRPQAPRRSSAASDALTAMRVATGSRGSPGRLFSRLRADAFSDAKIRINARLSEMRKSNQGSALPHDVPWVRLRASAPKPPNMPYPP